MKKFLAFFLLALILSLVPLGTESCAPKNATVGHPVKPADILLKLSQGMILVSSTLNEAALTTVDLQTTGVISKEEMLTFLDVLRSFMTKGKEANNIIRILDLQNISDKSNLLKIFDSMLALSDEALDKHSSNPKIKAFLLAIQATLNIMKISLTQTQVVYERSSKNITGYWNFSTASCQFT